MVVRVYCDHCGNAAHNAQKFVYGAHSYFFGGCEAAPAQATSPISQQHLNALNQQQAWGNGQGQAGVSTPKPVERPQAGSVDLCDTCQIVWMNRVKALTQASEP